MMRDAPVKDPPAVSAMQDLKVAAKHEPAFRCSFCHERVEPDYQAPCEGCGAVLHAECRVQHGGCPTLGCAHAAPTVRAREGAATGQAPQTAGRAGQLLASTMALGSLGAGVAGMVISFLALGAQVQGLVIAGAAGFVAGAVLVVAGVLALSIMASRREGQQSSPLTGVTPRAAAAIASRAALLCGAGGMALSFLTLLSSHVNELIAGGAGFVAGAILILGGVLGLAWETLSKDAFRGPGNPAP